MDMELWFIEKIEFTKDNGEMTREKAKEWKDIQMEINMKEIFIREKLMEKEYIIGQMEKFMMESGKMVLKKDTECGKEFLEILILDNGKTQRQMVMEFINGKMETDMKDLG